MDFLQEFNKMMTEQGDMALATSVGNCPNVRVVNFYYDPVTEGILYFSTFKDNRKVEEFSQNNTVSLTTFPKKESEHIRIKGAQVKKSNLTIFDMQEQFVKKFPDFRPMLDQAGSQIDLYEIHFKEADVIIDYMMSGKVSF